VKIPLYQVDAFTSRVFSGNPAAVCLLDGWPDDTLLQSIAAENNLSETAFLVRRGAAVELRWFTPRVEVALCGHATLAAAYVLFVCKQWMQDRIPFLTRSRGELTVTRKGDLIEMDFPALPALRSVPAASLKPALGVTPMKCLASEEDLLAVLDSEDAVRKARPDLSALAAFDCRGVIITAQGNTSDFVSRFFAPRVGISEDPVTGSAHCVLTPFWAERLGRNNLTAYQASARGGYLTCRLDGGRVWLEGHCVTVVEGRFFL